MPKLTAILSILILAGLAFTAPAGAADDPAPAPADAPWAVAATDTSPAVMTRTIENVTIDYHIVPDDYDALKLSVEPCRESMAKWYEKDGLAPEGAQDVKTSMADAFHNARLNCTLSDGLEDRFLDGFDAAYAQFQALNQ